MSEKKGSLIPGIILIVIGCWFFIKRIIYLEPHWFRFYPLLIIAFSVFLLIETVRRHNSGALFWGVTLLFIGGFFFLRNYGIIPYFYADEYWPLFLLAIGFGFVSLFAFNPKDWGIIIPAALFLFIGIIFSFGRLLHMFWGWEELIEIYWPIVLVLIGFGILAGSLTKKTKTDD